MNNPNTTAETRRESYEAITTETSKRGALILDVLGDKQMTVDVIVRRYIQTTGRKDVKCIRNGAELGAAEIANIFKEAENE